MGIDDARDRRAQRAEALATLGSGGVTLAETLLRPPIALRTCDVWYVLLACPKLGRSGARQVLERSGVFAHVPLGELSVTQRRLLVDELPPRAKGES